MVAAVIDVRTFTISNRLNPTVALLAPLYLVVDRPAPLARRGDPGRGRGGGVRVLAVTFYIGMMGGGDVKLAAALALVVLARRDPQIPGHHVARRRPADAGRADRSHRNAQAKTKAEPEVPYGVAIAIGALWILAQRFLNQFA